MPAISWRLAASEMPVRTAVVSLLTRSLFKQEHRVSGELKETRGCRARERRLDDVGPSIGKILRTGLTTHLYVHLLERLESVLGLEKNQFKLGLGLLSDGALLSSCQLPLSSLRWICTTQHEYDSGCGEADLDCGLNTSNGPSSLASNSLLIGSSTSLDLGGNSVELRINLGPKFHNNGDVNLENGGSVRHKTSTTSALAVVMLGQPINKEWRKVEHLQVGIAESSDRGIRSAHQWGNSIDDALQEKYGMRT